MIAVVLFSVMVWFYSGQKDSVLEVLIISSLLFFPVEFILFFLRKRITLFNSLICSLPCIYLSPHLLVLSYIWARATVDPAEIAIRVFLIAYFIAILVIILLGLWYLKLAKAGRCKQHETNTGRNAGILGGILILLPQLFNIQNYAMAIYIYLISISALFGIWGIIKVVFVAKHS